jgi:hypothetical protein
MFATPNGTEAKFGTFVEGLMSGVLEGSSEEFGKKFSKRFGG